MSLQIEYYAKVDVLHRMQLNRIDANKIVTDYTQSLSQSNQDILWSDISKHSNSIYSSNLIQTYFPIPKDYTSVPIWVIFELLSFGQFIHLYKYCAQELKDNNLLNQTYLMHTIKNIRNAAAHNSCLLNNIFEPINHRFQVNFALAQALAKDIPISKNTRSKILSRVQPYQIIAALYCYYSLVPNHLWDTNLLSSLHNVKDVMVHSQVCQTNRAVQTLFTIFSTIIDTWFPLV